MKKAFLLVVILSLSILSTACINNLAVQQLNNKANDYLKNGDYENAISRLKSSIDLDSTIFESHYNLGIAYTQSRRYPEAVDSFLSAIKINPDYADTYYSLGVAQESFAKGIIDGSLKQKTDNMNEENAENEQKSNENEERKLTPVEKEQVAKLYKDAKEAFQAYLQKSTNPTDKNAVENKIEYLQKEIVKYLNPANDTNDTNNAE